jgi:thiol-disulfide isomerase/thioredoxin
MKRFLILLLIIFPDILLFGQNTSIKLKPFIIEGQLTNFPYQSFNLYFDDGVARVTEIVDVNKEGKFRLESNKVLIGTTAHLQEKEVDFHLFIAPGYKLTMNGDFSNKESVSLTKHFYGYGSSANRYLQIMDSLSVRIKNKKEWFELNTHDLVLFENMMQKREDSVINLVFNSKKAPDEYYNFFLNKIRLNNKFLRLDNISWHMVLDKNFTYQQAVDFVSNNADASLLKNVNNEEYLVSDAYQTFMCDGYYIYLKTLDCKKDTSGCSFKNTTNYCAQIISSVYKGKIKDLALYKYLDDQLSYCRSFEELNLYKKELPPYIDQLSKQSKRDALEKLFSTKENELITKQIGRPAPLFTAEDSLGKSYSIIDYKGKVVVVDLWASWCEPCRAEGPYLGKIVDKYKTDNRIAFISVAVLDKKEAWKLAMKEDKPAWLQLFDTNGTVQNAYVANSIPKFIIIDKQGNIISFDAPMPTQNVELEKILDREISK